MQEVKEGYLEYYGKLMTDREVEELFNAVDISRSGFIDYSEFVVAAMHESQLTSQSKLKAAFHMFDKDGSGKIKPEAIRNLFSIGTCSNEKEQHEVNEIINEINIKHDGVIDFDEFVQMMT